MAVTVSKETYKNAKIDVGEGVIVEMTKDGDLVYDLKSFLSRWDGIEGVSIQIAKNADITPDKNEY